MAQGSSTTHSWKRTAIWLALFFILALTLRIAFNVDASFDEENGRYMYSGNDPDYHHRTVDHIISTGDSLIHDPLLKYPSGANNPNPPVFDWSTAPAAFMMDGSGAADGVGLALNIAVALWGALIIFPVYIIGKELWGRHAGLWAAFFMAVSAPHIQRTVWGYADHDATTLFWIALTFAFLLKALKAIHHREYVRSWRDMPGVLAGKKAAFLENREAMLWAALAGTALAATALTWKGYPYVLGVMAIAFGFQLISDHLRNKDSLPTGFVYLLPVVIAFLVALPYYSVVGFASGTIVPHLAVIIGMLVVAAVLIPTRELPSVLVFPALLVAAGIGLVALLLLVPEVGRTIFTGLGYFEQSKLYSTISEAQRSELGAVAAAFGFFTFVLAFWALGRVLKGAWRGQETRMLMAAWAAVALFMAFAASRFVVNAAPVFMVFIGAGTAWIIEKAGLADVARRHRAQHGQNRFASFFRSLTWRSSLVVVAVAVLLVAPNVWIGVDAGTSIEYDIEKGLYDGSGGQTDRFGAYGISFDIADNGWLELFDALAARDTHLAPADRPAFIAWWDYGHWATLYGEHPSVADPFQSNHKYAGRFLASETEGEAMNWLSVLFLNTEVNRGGLNSDVRAALEANGVDPDAYTAVSGLDNRFAVVNATDDPFALYDALSDATGYKVGYMGVDSRMYPVSEQQTGIFYAPAFLANKNPDEFLQTTYRGQGLTLTLEQYGVDENGDSFRLSEPRFVDQQGKEWIVSGGQAYPKAGFIPGAGGGQGGVAVQPQFSLSERFHNSMYARAYGGPSATQQPAGDGLTHWRAIHDSTRPAGQGQAFRQATLLQYYVGHTVTGMVTDDSGAAMQGVEVTFVDGFGAAHDAMTTGADGSFEVLAPFGDDLHLAVRADGAVLHQEPWTLSEAEADGGRTDGVQVQVQRGGIAGVVYNDVDGEPGFQAGADEPLEGAAVTINGQSTTTGADGRYSFTGMTPGSYSMQVSLAGYEERAGDVTVTSGSSEAADVELSAQPSPTTVTFLDGGQGVAGVPIQFAGPADETATTGADGTATVPLAPGDYTVTVDHAFTNAEGQEVVYEETRTITVPFGGEPFAFTIEAS